MSDTVRRTVYYSWIKGNIAFFDWVAVSSEQGVMVEALNLNQCNNGDNAFDPADPTNIISEFKECEFHKIANMPPFADEDVQWHGGTIRTKTF